MSGRQQRERSVVSSEAAPQPSSVNSVHHAPSPNAAADAHATATADAAAAAAAATTAEHAAGAMGVGLFDDDVWRAPASAAVTGGERDVAATPEAAAAAAAAAAQAPTGTLRAAQHAHALDWSAMLVVDEAGGGAAAHAAGERLMPVVHGRDGEDDGAHGMGGAVSVGAASPSFAAMDTVGVGQLATAFASGAASAGARMGSAQLEDSPVAGGSGGASVAGAAANGLGNAGRDGSGGDDVGQGALDDLPTTMFSSTGMHLAGSFRTSLMAQRVMAEADVSIPTVHADDSGEPLVVPVSFVAGRSQRNSAAVARQAIQKLSSATGSVVAVAGEPPSTGTVGSSRPETPTRPPPRSAVAPANAQPSTPTRLRPRRVRAGRVGGDLDSSSSAASSGGNSARGSDADTDGASSGTESERSAGSRSRAQRGAAPSSGPTPQRRGAVPARGGAGAGGGGGGGGGSSSRALRGRSTLAAGGGLLGSAAGKEESGTEGESIDIDSDSNARVRAQPPPQPLHSQTLSTDAPASSVAGHVERLGEAARAHGATADSAAPSALMFASPFLLSTEPHGASFFDGLRVSSSTLHGGASSDAHVGSDSAAAASGARMDAGDVERVGAREGERQVRVHAPGTRQGPGVAADEHAVSTADASHFMQEVDMDLGLPRHEGRSRALSDAARADLLAVAPTGATPMLGPAESPALRAGDAGALSMHVHGLPDLGPAHGHALGPAPPHGGHEGDAHAQPFELSHDVLERVAANLSFTMGTPGVVGSPSALGMQSVAGAHGALDFAHAGAAGAGDGGFGALGDGGAGLGLAHASAFDGAQGEMLNAAHTSDGARDAGLGSSSAATQSDPGSASIPLATLLSAAQDAMLSSAGGGARASGHASAAAAATGRAAAGKRPRVAAGKALPASRGGRARGKRPVGLASALRGDEDADADILGTGEATGRDDGALASDGREGGGRRRGGVRGAGGNGGDDNDNDDGNSDSDADSEDGDTDHAIMPVLRDYEFLVLRSAPEGFTVSIAPVPLCVADVHAHLSTHEVVGLLGGRFRASDNVLEVLAVLPGRTSGAHSSDTDVELDPRSEVEMRDRLAQMGLQCVGWYHSHPRNRAMPSRRDMATQLQYERMFAAHQAGGAFVGLIVSPFSEFSRSASQMKLFRTWPMSPRDIEGVAEAEANRGVTLASRGIEYVQATPTDAIAAREPRWSVDGELAVEDLAVACVELALAYKDSPWKLSLSARVGRVGVLDHLHESLVHRCSALTATVWRTIKRILVSDGSDAPKRVLARIEMQRRSTSASEKAAAKAANAEAAAAAKAAKAAAKAAAGKREALVTDASASAAPVSDGEAGDPADAKRAVPSGGARPAAKRVQAKRAPHATDASVAAAAAAASSSNAGEAAQQLRMTPVPAVVGAIAPAPAAVPTRVGGPSRARLPPSSSAVRVASGAAGASASGAGATSEAPSGPVLPMWSLPKFSAR